MSKRMSRTAGRNIDPPLTDRERILMEIINQLSFTQSLRPVNAAWSSEPFRDGDRYYVHFAKWQQPKAGDLVLAETGHVSRWKLGWYVEKLSDEVGGAVIREIGSNRLCNYANESFCPIVGMDPIALLEGDQRKLYIKVLKAFRKGDEYSYCFGGLRFEGEEAIVRVREKWTFEDSVPFEVRFTWTKRMSVASILKSLIEGGYGARSFRPEGWVPPDQRKDIVAPV